MFEAVRQLSQAMTNGSDLDLRVVGFKDNESERDRHLWGNLIPVVFPTMGPRRFGYSPELRKWLQQFHADLVHTHGLWMYNSAAAHGWSQYANKPCVVTPHGMLDPWALENSRWKKVVASVLFENANLHHAACLHALCKAEATSFRAYGLRNPICVIPNGIDLPGTGNARFTLGNPPWHHLVEPGRKVLLYLGRIHPKKGLVNLLRAWAAVQRSMVPTHKQSEWVLAIAGWDQSGHEAELKRLASELLLSFADVREQRSDNLGESKGNKIASPSVLFLGPQFNEAKAACYANCDTFILPSFSEGLPMTILEAWSHGKPLLMTSECNLPEGFVSGSALRITTDVEDIKRGICTRLEMSDADAQAMGQRGFQLVSQRFVWPEIAHQMRSVYEWVLGGGPKPDCIL